MHWLITAGALLQLLSLTPDKAFVTREFNRSSTVVISPWRHPPPSIRSWRVGRAISVTSIAGLERTLAGGVPPGVHFVVFDIERWPLTPAGEQTHPVQAVRKAAQLTHDHGLLLIAAPATDLIWGLEPADARREGQFAAFVRSGLARRIARVADWYVIQAERAEGAPSRYRAYVQAISRQVHAARPDTVVLGEVETNHAGHAVPVSLLFRDIESTRHAVQGEWLGIPQQGVYCGDCGKPHPEVAVALLRRISRVRSQPPLSAWAGSAPIQSPLIWLFAGSGISHLAEAPGGKTLLHSALNQPDTWVIGKSPDMPPLATRLGGAANLKSFRRAVESPVPAIVLDVENWPMTPPAEKKHPVATYAKAARIAAAHHKILIATPAMDLVRAVDPSSRGPLYRRFLELRLAARIAPYANVYEIQAQGIENDPRRYLSLVRAIARQVRSSHPQARILAGLSTGPSGKTTDAGTLYQDVKETRGIVSGYWLNIPGRSKWCPRCTTPQPEIAVRLLRMLLRPSP